MKRRTFTGVFDPCAESPVTRRFVEELVGASRPFPSLIHAADDMYRYNLASLRGSRPCAAILYYAKGWQIFQTVRNLAAGRFGALAAADSMLDFASGHGRVTRFLLGELDPSRICVSEIHADAVSFQQEYFGVAGLLSTSDPSAFACDRRFELVVASSFFSHVPPSSFQEWMAALLRCVEPSGIFLFSALGSELLSHEAMDWSNGIVFLPESESDRLSTDAYGTSYVTEEFVREAIGRAGNEGWTVQRFPRGLCGLQDLYLAGARDTVESVGFKPIDLPWGDVDLYEIRSDGTLRIAGWVNTRQQELAALQVEFSVNNHPVALCKTELVAPGAFRWSLETDASRTSPDEVLMIKAIAAAGLDNIIGLGTLRTHPPADRDSQRGDRARKSSAETAVS